MLTTHQPRKRFGQHFLTDPSVIARIIAAIAPLPEQFLVEIGPGMGALTKALLTQTHQLTAIEIDRDVVPILQQQCAGLGELIVHQADVLKYDFSALCASDRLMRIVGNLPYNISTPLLFHLLKIMPHIQDCYFMLQEEVVDRIVALPNSEHYGRLSVMIQYYCQAKKLFTIPPSAFTPRPKVYSAILKLVPHRRLPNIANNLDTFTQIVREAFSQRRKTIRNSLKNWISAAELITLGLDPQQRPEELSVGDFVRVSNFASNKFTI